MWFSVRMSGEHLEGCGAGGLAQVALDPGFARQLAAGMLAASGVHGHDGLLSENGRTAFAFPSSQPCRLADCFCFIVRGASCNCSSEAQ